MLAAHASDSSDPSIDRERRKVHGQTRMQCKLGVPYSGKLRTDLLVAVLNTIYNFFYIY